MIASSQKLGPDHCGKGGQSGFYNLKVRPGTRDFCRENFPDAETRSPIKILVTRSAYRNPLIISALEQSHTYYEAVHRLATSSDDSEEASRTIILGDYPEAMQRASQLLFEDAVGPTDDLLSKGYMTNLAVQSVDGVN